MDDLVQELSAMVSAFNGLDWIIFVVVVLSMLLGIVRGFGREMLSLLGWICAFVAANLLAKPLADTLHALSDSETVRYLLSWILVFVGVLAVFSVLGNLLAKQLRQPGFNLGNRFLGGSFGVVRGMVVVMAATLVLKGLLPDSEQDLLEDASLMPMIDTMADWFSENFDDLLDAKPVEQMEDSLDSADMI